MERLGEEWKGMRRDVERILQSCAACQAWTLGKHRFAPLRASRVRLPWQQCQMDFLTSLPETKDGFKYALIWLCIFTDFLLLRKMRTKEAAELAEVS